MHINSLFRQANNISGPLFKIMTATFLSNKNPKKFFKLKT